MKIAISNKGFKMKNGINKLDGVCVSLFLTTVVLVSVISSTKADTMVLQYGSNSPGSYQGTVDAAVGPDAASVFFQSNQTWKIGVSGSTTATSGAVSLMTFNDSNGTGISFIGSGNSIDSAMLTLTIASTFVHPSYTWATPTLYVAPVTSSWNETAGAILGSVPSFDSSLADSLTFTTGMTAGTTVTLDITNIVNAWYNGMANNGLIFYTGDNHNNFNYISFYYRTANDGANGSMSPMLTINFSAIPEPSIYALLLGGLCLLTGLRYWRKLT
ncbi:MAG: DNRLRE domain-containing protein [Verrucomicrobiales bacterium]|jgi:hypothetical protein|nr:DNRLRE domain-containing protein [Verrucomicrobiales bacterium]